MQNTFCGISSKVICRKHTIPNCWTSKMNLLLFGFLAVNIELAFAKNLIYKNHSCLPSTYTKICILEDPQYNPKHHHVIHSFPPNQSHVRIISESNKPFVVINSKLHSLLGRPSVLEVQASSIWHVELPRALRQLIFIHAYLNIIGDLSVEPGTDTPKMVYLDLSRTDVRNMACIRELINLEVLLLKFNFIQSIDQDMMKNFSKLRILDLSYNYLTSASLNVFPKSLTHLNLFHNSIESLKYDHLYYPSMQVLNLARNKLTTIDASALILAMPNVKTVRIAGNHFSEPDELQHALNLFRKQNISFRDQADQLACYYSREILEGVCVREPDPPRDVFWDFLMSFAVILVVTVLVVILRWILSAMQGSS